MLAAAAVHPAPTEFRPANTGPAQAAAMQQDFSVVSSNAALLRLLADFSRKSSLIFMKLHNTTVSLDHRILKLRDMFNAVQQGHFPRTMTVTGIENNISSVSNNIPEVDQIVQSLDSKVIVPWGIKLSEVVQKIPNYEVLMRFFFS